jgi:hypothetical protein
MNLQIIQPRRVHLLSHLGMYLPSAAGGNVRRGPVKCRNTERANPNMSFDLRLCRAAQDR